MALHNYIKPNAEPATPRRITGEQNDIFVFDAGFQVPIKLGQKVAVAGHNGALHLALVTGANTDGTLTLVIFAHQQFEGQQNESDMGVHFRNNVPVSDVIPID